MARDFVSERERTRQAEALQQGLGQLTDAANLVVAVSGQLASLRQQLQASEDFDAADLARLDGLTERVVALRTAAQAYLAK